ncbi:MULTISPECIES: hypothetical protein [Candidatus Ichthyocystis]|uniref:Uncharacterized protein n=1 Tax=Candidatus Ichthyocystis hellenicum TaxID=1561003 RepID=A0A0S4M1U6_9BURK|nr:MULTISPECIES: hypothetical protein [Ichthyocystis]CUT17259.1 hypothetical protein Ark11_0410 [Candidatus Ichthyocystis hellenicum]
MANIRESYQYVDDSDCLEGGDFAEALCLGARRLSYFSSYSPIGRGALSQASTFTPRLSDITGVVGEEYEHSSLDEIIEHNVTSHFERGNFGSLVKDLVKGVFLKFIGVNICEHEYKQFISLSSSSAGRDFILDRVIGTGGEAGLLAREEIVDLVLRVAVNVVVGVDLGCDFLLSASRAIVQYFMSCLGISAVKVTRVFLKAKMSVGDVSGFYVGEKGWNVSDFLASLSRLRAGDRETSGAASELVVGLLAGLFSLVKGVAGTDVCYCDNRYFEDISFRSSLNPAHVVMLLEKIVSLLILFPEVLHPKFVWRGGIDRKAFCSWFTPECSVKTQAQFPLFDKKGLFSGIVCASGKHEKLSLSERIESTLACYFEKDLFGCLVRKLIKDVSVKFTSCNMCEWEYKRVSILSGERHDFGPEMCCVIRCPDQERVVDTVLRVAVNIMVGVESGCDFLLNASRAVKRHFVSNLGVSVGEVGRILLESGINKRDASGSSELALDRRVSELLIRLSGRVTASSLEDLKNDSSELLVRLSRLRVGARESMGVASELVSFFLGDVASLVKDFAGTDVCSFNNRYFKDVLFRASLDPVRVSKFLYRILLLLVLFPEALHPRFVWRVKLAPEFFNSWFTLEGRCPVR